MSCFTQQPCCPTPVPCPPPITITAEGQQRCDKKTVFALPAVNIIGKLPPPACGGKGGGDGSSGNCSNLGKAELLRISGEDSGNCSGKEGCEGIVRARREKRWPMCNLMNPCIDGRVYRDGEFMCITYSGHVPGEQFITGRNFPTTTTFAKRRLCQSIPKELVDADGCPCLGKCVFK